MRIEHGDAIVLEGIVRGVFSCQRGEMGGYIDADRFESEPFDAALIALSPLWKKPISMKSKISYGNGTRIKKRE